MADLLQSRTILIENGPARDAARKEGLVVKRTQKIIFAEMRSLGVRGPLAYLLPTMAAATTSQSAATNNPIRRSGLDERIEPLP